MGVLNGGLFERAAFATTGALHRRMDALLVQSKAFATPLCRQGVRSDRVHYVPNWAEELYRPMTVPAEVPERRQLPVGFTILFAGNIGVAQGFDVVLRAAEMLRGIKDLHWVILGSGRKAEWLAQEVKERGLEHTVHLLGRHPVATMPIWFSLADVLLATLRLDPVYELTLPSKLQTYLACGKPILASLDGEGSRVLKESGAGLVTQAGDASSLAAGARRLYDAGPDALATMGRCGLRYYREHFDRAAVIDRVETLMQDCAARCTNGEHR
jgi:glycosyltransferase involved in cell wall biosynthesis